MTLLDSFIRSFKGEKRPDVKGLYLDRLRMSQLLALAPLLRVPVIPGDTPESLRARIREVTSENG